MPIPIEDVFGNISIILNERGDEVGPEVCVRCSSPGGECVCQQDSCPRCGMHVGGCNCPVEPVNLDLALSEEDLLARLLRSDADFVAAAHHPERATPETEARWAAMQGSTEVRSVRQAVERTHGGRPRSERVTAEVLKLAKDLAAQIIGAKPGFTEVTAKMRSLAAGIAGLTGVAPVKDMKSGRAFIDDLVVGEVYLAHGWGGNEFEWTYLGMGVDSDDHVMIRRSGKDPTSEALGDHGLGAYASGTSGALWHPTNWTESLGIKENAAASVANAIAHEAGMSNMETFGDFGGGNDIS